MGYDKTVYVGPYVKVYLPKVGNKEEIMTCPKKDCSNHGKRARASKFCGKCGEEIKLVPFTRKRSFNIYQALEDRIDEDNFFVATQEWIGSNEKEDFVLFLPNCGEQGGHNIDEHEYGEYSFTDTHYDSFAHEDWTELIEVLTDLKLKFEKKIAIVKYYH